MRRGRGGRVLGSAVKVIIVAATVQVIGIAEWQVPARANEPVAESSVAVPPQVAMPSAAPGTVTWATNLAGAYLGASSVAIGGSGVAAVGGTFHSALSVDGQVLVPQEVDGWVGAIDPGDGTVLWAHQLGGTGVQNLAAVAVDDAGAVFATFSTSSTIDVGGTVVTPVGDRAVVVARFDGESGSVDWVRQIDAATDLYPMDLDVAGGVLAVAIESLGPVSFGTDATTQAGVAVATFDLDGSTQGITDAISRNHLYGVAGAHIDMDPDGTVVLAASYTSAIAIPGVTLPYNGWPSTVVVHYGASGQVASTRAVQSTLGTVVDDIAIGTDGSVYLSGSHRGTLTIAGQSTTDAGYVLRLGPDLQDRWLRGLANVGASALDVTAADDVVIGAVFSGSTNVGGLLFTGPNFWGDVLMAGLDRDGAWRWVEASLGAKADTVGDVAATGLRAVAVGAHEGTITFGSQLLPATATENSFMAGYVTGQDVDAFSYTPMTPVRVLDSRTDVGGHPLPFTQIVDNVRVAGVFGIPSDAVAVVANVTVTGPTEPSHLTLFPTGTTKPLASNLNFLAGQTVANLTTLRVGLDGYVAIANNSGWTQVIIDVVGYYRAFGAELTGVAPQRVLDSRDGTGGYSTRWGAGVERPLTIGGVAGVPADADAVIVNLTVTNATQASHLTVWPDGVPMPVASNLNFVAGQTRPNLAIVALGTAGRIRIFNNAGQVDVIADVVGYFRDEPSGGRFHPIDPHRIVDSRDGTGGWSTSLGQATRSFGVGGVAGVPAEASAAVMNVTGPTAPSHLTLWPAGVPKPLASNLNYVAGETVPNAAILALGSAGKLSATNNSGQAHVIVDVLGWFD